MGQKNEFSLRVPCRRDPTREQQTVYIRSIANDEQTVAVCLGCDTMDGSEDCASCRRELSIQHSS